MSSISPPKMRPVLTRPDASLSRLSSSSTLKILQSWQILCNSGFQASPPPRGSEAPSHAQIPLPGARCRLLGSSPWAGSWCCRCSCPGTPPAPLYCQHCRSPWWSSCRREGSVIFTQYNILSVWRDSSIFVFLNIRKDNLSEKAVPIALPVSEHPPALWLSVGLIRM